MKQVLFVAFLCTFAWGYTQEKKPEGKQINIVYGANFTKDEANFPGASIFSKDEERQVQFEHQGADIWCDVAVFYSQEKKLKAIGNVRLQQGDSIEMNSGKLDYDGKDNKGNQVSSGIYFYQIKAGSYEATKRMVILR